MNEACVKLIVQIDLLLDFAGTMQRRALDTVESAYWKRRINELLDQRIELMALRDLGRAA